MKLCCVFNYNPLYRWPIFHAMDDEFDCDFFFGDTVHQNIQNFDPNKLRGFRHYIITKKIGKRGFVFHKNIKDIFSKQYTHYLLTGNSSYGVNWLVLLYAKLFKIKVYLWTHGIHSSTSSKKGKFVNKLFFKYVDGIFLYGEYAVPYMIDIGCKQEKLHIIHNSLDTNLQTDIYNSISPDDVYSSHFGNHRPNVIYLGRIQKRKKIDELIKAIALCKNAGEFINLTLVGPQEDDDSIFQQVKELKIDNQLWLYGPCYDEEHIAKLLYNADVFVCPSAVGLSCIHSLSYGTPVVTNDDFENQMPEFEAIQEGVTGSFFKNTDVQDLANKITFWIHRNKEEKLITRKAARREILKAWSVDYQINVFKSVLESSLS